jgi:hypothetical protein
LLLRPLVALLVENPFFVDDDIFRGLTPQTPKQDKEKNGVREHQQPDKQKRLVLREVVNERGLLAIAAKVRGVHRQQLVSSEYQKKQGKSVKMSIFLSSKTRRDFDGKKSLLPCSFVTDDQLAAAQGFYKSDRTASSPISACPLLAEKEFRPSG